jgi:mediator of RNA polymerase II transcription subunit 14
VEARPYIMDIAASSSVEHGLTNGVHTNGFDSPTLEELEQDLPMVYDGQVALGDLLSRVVQGIYAELSELAETYVAQVHASTTHLDYFF